MKSRNFLRIVIFIVGLFLIGQLVGRQFVRWSRADINYSITHSEFVAMQDKVWMVVLGDSHPQKGVKTPDIPGAYTLATSSESYPFTYYIMKYYLEEMDFHPKVAVLTIDPNGFISSRMNGIKRRDPAFWDFYVNYLEIDATTEEFADYLPTIVEAKLSFLGGWDVTMNQLWPLESQVSDYQELGFISLESRMSDMAEWKIRQDGIARADKHFDGKYLDEALVTYFLKLIDLLQAHDVDVVLVWYPMSDGYYEGMNQYLSGEEHLSKVEELLGDRQVDLILDYHDFFFGQPEYFADPDHLNKWGAAIFTEDLYANLIEAGLVPPEGMP